MKKRISLSLALGMVALGLASCDLGGASDTSTDSTIEPESSSSIQESVPEEYRNLFDFTNVTIKISEETNVWLVKHISKDEVYKIDNLEPAKVNYDDVKSFIDYSSYHKSFKKHVVDEESTSYYAENVPLYDKDGNEYASNGTISLSVSNGLLSSIQLQWQDGDNWKYTNISFYDYGTTVLNPDYSSIPESWKSMFFIPNVTVKTQVNSNSSLFRNNFTVYEISETELYHQQGSEITVLDPDDYEPTYFEFLTRKDALTEQETSNPSNQSFTAETVELENDNVLENVKITIWDNKISLITYERNFASGIYYQVSITLMNYDTTVDPR